MQCFLQKRRIGQQLANDAGREKAHDPRQSQPGKTSRDHTEAESNGASPDTDGVIIVRTSGEDDPIDPRNWPLASRAKNIAVVALLIFCQAWAGGAESMANAAASNEFGVSPVAENLSTALYLFGIGSGSLFAGPMSETFGRTATYIVPTFCYLFFVLGTALTPTFGGQLVCRYFVGVFSSATLSINGSTVRDQFRPVKRSFVFPVIAWANVVGKTARCLVPSAMADWRSTRTGARGWRLHCI